MRRSIKAMHSFDPDMSTSTVTDSIGAQSTGMVAQCRVHQLSGLANAARTPMIPRWYRERLGAPLVSYILSYVLLCHPRSLFLPGMCVVFHHLRLFSCDPFELLLSFSLRSTFSLCTYSTKKDIYLWHADKLSFRATPPVQCDNTGFLQ